MKKQKTYELLEIPEKSKIVCELSDGSTYLIFYHIDGLYSYCETEKGGVINIYCGTKLIKEKDYYILSPKYNETTITKVKAVIVKDKNTKTKPKPAYYDVAIRLTLHIKAKNEDDAVKIAETTKLPKNYLKDSLEIMNVDLVK